MIPPGDRLITGGEESVEEVHEWWRESEEVKRKLELTAGGVT